MVAARRRGLSFEDFWCEAMRPRASTVMVTTPNPPAGAVRWPTDRNDRVSWQAALSSAKDGWRRAYERVERKPGEEALAYLADEIGALADAAAVLDKAERRLTAA
jgi:hypothetical protein